MGVSAQNTKLESDDEELDDILDKIRILKADVYKNL